MATTPPESLEIVIPDITRPHAKVTAGRARRVFFSTPQAVGLALLSEMRAPGEAGAGDYRWHDHLATHGIAVGQRSLQTATIAVIPPTERQVSMAGSATPFQATFPRMLIGILQKEGVFQRGVMFCLAAATPNLNIQATPAVAAPFPYGNVHANGHICWGTIRHDGITSLASLIALFFDSGFNADLCTPAVCGIRTTSNLSTMAAGAPGGILPPPTTFSLTIPQAVSHLIGS